MFFYFDNKYKNKYSFMILHRKNWVNDINDWFNIFFVKISNITKIRETNKNNIQLITNKTRDFLIYKNIINNINIK